MRLTPPPLSRVLPLRLHARWALPALVIAALSTAGAAQALTLTVEVLDARSTQGTINAALYGSDSAWLKIEQATQTQKQDAAGPKTVLVFRDLAPGRYALSTFHDENRNDRLDSNVMGMPTEPYGFSRDAVGSFSAPGFNDAAVDLQDDTTLQIHLH